MKLITSIIVLGLVGLTIQESSSQSPTYTAGVIEFVVNDTVTGEEFFNQNTLEYLVIIESPQALPTDILVFPESTLNDESTAIDVPHPHERIIPCLNDSYNINLQSISCSAQLRRKYVVVNLVMRRNCTEEALENEDDRPCSSDDWNLYNTNVVFDRHGMVISIYRKFNDHGTFNRTLVPDMSTFSTDFGVTFGHLISLDILTESPAMDLLRLNVQNFVYPVRWYSEIPFLTAVQIQEGWAITNNVNFLAAGANQPSRGSSGSGIYSGTVGALRSLVTGVAINRLLVHAVPKVPGLHQDSMPDLEIGSMLQNLIFLNDPISLTSYHFINTTNTSMHNIHLCQQSVVNQLCCNFEIQVTARPTPENSIQYSYIAAAFNGYRSIAENKEAFIRTCVILACTSNNITTCGTAHPTDQNVENSFNFAVINITATGLAAVNDITMPSTLTLNLLPLPRTQYHYQEVTVNTTWDHSTAEISILEQQDELLTFGIFTRDFTFSAASKLYSSAGIILLIAFWI